MKIVALEAENIKRLRAVHIVPGEPVTVLGGRNAQGKTSVLDAIEMVLGGKNSVPAKPVRKGEESARIVADLGDIIVERTFTADGKTALKVKNRDGAVYQSPQTMLDALVGKLSFDPLAFTKLDAHERADLLCKLVGLDLNKFASRRQALYDERTRVNRDIKQQTARVNDMPCHEDVPAEEISIAELSKQATEAARLHNEAMRADVIANEMESAIQRQSEKLAALERETTMLRASIDEAKAKAVVARASAEELEKALPDDEAIQGRIVEAESTNQKVRQNAARQVAVKLLNETKSTADRLTTQIESVDTEKLAAIAAAKFPIDGLSVSENGVTYNGIPLEQSSAAEQLRVSAAISAAMNPKLRVQLIRDGSLLDAAGMKALADFAAENDMQIWLERVTEDHGACTVLIEDGGVVSAQSEAAE